MQPDVSKLPGEWGTLARLDRVSALPFDLHEVVGDVSESSDESASETEEEDESSSGGDADEMSEGGWPSWYLEQEDEDEDCESDDSPAWEDETWDEL